MKLAAVQFEPTLFRKAENTAALLRLAGEAADVTGPGGLVVLPEMATTGYVYSGRSEITPYVEPIPGPTTKVFGRLAASRGVSLVLGMPEVDPATGAYYNSAVLLGPDGKVVGVYRKTHSFHCDTLWAAEGDLGLPVLHGPWPGPLGLVVCMDAGFFEPARVEAQAGARVIAFPTNWLRTAPSPEWRARAAENGIYLVAADRWGTERGTRFAGGTCIIGPDGEVLAVRDTGDGVVVAEAVLEGGAAAGLARGPFFGGLVRRRPELYHDLLRHSNLWPDRFIYPGLGSGRFRLSVAQEGSPGARAGSPAAGETSSGGASDLAGTVRALPPLGCQGPARGKSQTVAELLEMAASEGAYLAAAAGRGAEVVLAGPAGLIGRYASPHIPGTATRVRDGGGPGAGEPAFPVFDLPFARLGLLHSLDLLVPEAPRILAKLGADAILVSGEWPQTLDHLRFLWGERADTNDAYLAVATDRGRGVFGGREKPTRPGERADEDSVDVETGSYTHTRRKDTLRRLRPDLYLPLVAPGPGRD